MYHNIKVITFAQGDFLNSQNKLKEHLINVGITNSKHFTDSDLSLEFYKKYNYLFKYERGFGYWIWKPHVILQELINLRDDEFLLYIDSTDFPSKEFFDLIFEKSHTDDYIFISQFYKHGSWSKRDCFILMNCDEPKFHNSYQLEAGILGFKKTSENILIIKEWFYYMQNENILTDVQNICGKPNLPQFVEHRHDQSILTNIFLKRGLKSTNIKSDMIRFGVNHPKYDV